MEHYYARCKNSNAVAIFSINFLPLVSVFFKDPTQYVISDTFKVAPYRLLQE